MRMDRTHIYENDIWVLSIPQIIFQKRNDVNDSIVLLQMEGQNLEKKMPFLYLAGLMWTEPWLTVLDISPSQYDVPLDCISQI